MDTASAALLVVAVAVLVAAIGIVVVGTSRARARRAPDDPERSLTAAHRGLEAARAQATAARERATREAERLRAAADAELEARSDALEASERRLSWLFDELQSSRTALEGRRGALDERRGALEGAREELLAGRERTRLRRLEAGGIAEAEAEAAVLSRVGAELASDHPGRVSRAVADRLGDLAPTADMHLAAAIERQDGSHADVAPRASGLSLEGVDDEARERLLGALAVVAEDTFTEVGVDSERSLVSLRGLDPIGREVARQASIEALERRLDAAEVAPLLLRTRVELRRTIASIGERVLWEMGIEGRPELAELLGTLQYRFSYGQNALLHCQETGHLCAALAAELRMDPAEARRAGLYHDIGKAVDHDVEGSHAIIGGEMLSVLGIDEGIVHAVKAHHFDEEPSTDLAMLTICADAISASRPGARRDTLTTYVQRLEQLQQIATRHRGVERAFPMQAGREVRVSVRPDQVSDAQIPQLCGEIAREIEAEMTYPGMIKVTVIRETVASATAS